MARERGDKAELLRLLLDGRDFAEAARVGESLHHGAAAEQERAADVYERRRMWAEAAALRERLGQLARARELYQAGRSSRSKRRASTSSAGRVREAGIAYERFLADEPRRRRRGARAPGARPPPRRLRPPRGGRAPPAESDRRAPKGSTR